MTAKPRNSVLLLLKLIVAASLTTLLVRYASPSNIVVALRSADIWLVLTFIPLALLCMWLAAMQLKILIDCHGMNISLMRIIGINASTEFYNLFLFGIISGGAIRWYRLSKDNNMRAQALAVIAANRLLNTFFLIVAGIVGWLIEGNYKESFFAFGFLAMCAVALAAGFFVLSNPKFSAMARRKLGTDADERSFIKGKLLKLVNAANEYRGIPAAERLLLSVYGITWHLAVISSTYLFCLALNISMTWSALAWIRAIVTLALMVPITISGFGIREGTWIYFLGLYGVSVADAFVLSLLTFVRVLFQAIIGFTLEMKNLFHAK